MTLYAVWTALVGLEDDPSATITGNDSDGYVIKPSDGKTEIVVTVPDGFDARKITVEVSPDVQTVRANGATLKVVKGGYDITGYLDGLAPDAQGRINLADAEIKEEIVRETLDTAKGAVIELNATAPSLTTSETKPGLTYQFYEGATLEAVGSDLQATRPSDTKLGDGTPWTPTITIKGGQSGFYSIDVAK